MSKEQFFLIPESISNHIGYEASLVLVRIQYWINVCGKTIDNENGLWIYNSMQKWKEQFPFFSLYKVKKIIYYLEKLGILLSKKVNAKKWNHTKWYTIDLEKLNNMIAPIKEINKKTIPPKATNRLVENQLIINVQRNSYKNNIFSFKKKIFNNNPKPTKTIPTRITSEALIIAKNMVDAWNKEYEYSISPIIAHCNGTNYKILYDLWNTVFQRDIKTWKEYALKVNSSKFLMGEKNTKTPFKATFSWLTRKEVVEKILAGEYGVGDREVDKNNISKNIEAKKNQITSLIHRKITEYLSNSVSSIPEMEEFYNYINNELYLKDGDILQIKHFFYSTQGFSKWSLLNDPKFLALKEDMFKSFIMKKRFNITTSEIKNYIINIISKISTRNTGCSLLKKLKDLENKLQNICCNQYVKNRLLQLSKRKYRILTT